MTTNEIRIYAGDSDNELVTLTDQNGAAINLTDYKIVFTVKKNINDSAYLIRKRNAAAGGSVSEILMSDPTHGTFKIIILHEDTEPLRGQGNRFIYDVQIELLEFKKTAILSDFIVEEDVTW